MRPVCTFNPATSHIVEVSGSSIGDDEPSFSTDGIQLRTAPVAGGQETQLAFSNCYPYVSATNWQHEPASK